MNIKAMNIKNFHHTVCSVQQNWPKARQLPDSSWQTLKHNSKHQLHPTRQVLTLGMDDAKSVACTRDNSKHGSGKVSKSTSATVLQDYMLMHPEKASRYERKIFSVLLQVWRLNPMQRVQLAQVEGLQQEYLCAIAIP